MTEVGSGFFVYIATAGDNRILVLHMVSATVAPAIVQKVDLARNAGINCRIFIRNILNNRRVINFMNCYCKIT